MSLAGNTFWFSKPNYPSKASIKLAAVYSTALILVNNTCTKADNPIQYVLVDTVLIAQKYPPAIRVSTRSLRVPYAYFTSFLRVAYA